MKRVLIADDEPAILETVSEFVSDEGYEVLAARNGREALELLRAQEVDFILLDVMMPVMDGREVCAEVKQHPEWSKIPLVFMTAAPRVAADSPCPPDRILPKPFEIDALLRLLHQHLGEPRKGEQSAGGGSAG